VEAFFSLIYAANITHFSGNLNCPDKIIVFTIGGFDTPLQGI
jgi:hypothetical protein